MSCSSCSTRRFKRYHPCRVTWQWKKSIIFGWLLSSKKMGACSWVYMKQLLISAGVILTRMHKKRENKHHNPFHQKQKENYKVSSTLQGTKISHLGKRNIIDSFKSTIHRGCVSSRRICIFYIDIFWEFKITWERAPKWREIPKSWGWKLQTIFLCLFLVQFFPRV